jgi:hypothetical protein
VLQDMLTDLDKQPQEQQEVSKPVFTDTGIITYFDKHNEQTQQTFSQYPRFYQLDSFKKQLENAQNRKKISSEKCFDKALPVVKSARQSFNNSLWTVDVNVSSYV